MRILNTSVILFLLIIFNCYGQQTTKASGPIIKDYGAVYKVSQVGFNIEKTTILKAVFDVDRTFEATDKTNPLIETAARFLNLHAQSGFKPSAMNVALVIHGSASQDILTDDAYNAKFGIDNPNTPLIKALDKVGVDIILCGQTASHRDISKKEVLPEIKFALSAMTALIELQNKDYRLIKF